MSGMGNTYRDHFKEKMDAMIEIEARMERDRNNPYLMGEYVKATNLLLFAVMGVVEKLADAKEAAEAPVEATIFTMQRIIGDWSAKTFPASTIDSTLRHLWTEMVELDRAFTSGYDDDRREEVADLFILLVQLCNRATIDLQQAVRQKHAENLTRRWDAPDKHGVVYHTKESN